MKELFIKGKEDFKAYVASLFINDKFKSYVANDLFIDRSQQEYLIYPEIFFPAFCVEPQKYSKEIIKLNIAGYLYYRSIIEIDSSVDNVVLPEGKQPEKHYLPIISSICQEESIKLLTSLFQLNPVFWEIWNKRRSEYVKALMMDKSNPQVISLKEFELLADYKSAFGKVAIDASFILSGSTDHDSYLAVLESHKVFSAGFQLVDDILDFKKDLINPQINYAYISLIDQLNKTGLEYDRNNFELLNKYLYLHGTAESLIKLAIDYFNKSLLLVNKMDLNVWESFIRNNIYRATSMLNHLITYNKIIDAKVRLSKTYCHKNTVNSSIGLAKGFVLAQQKPDGSWEDFVNNAGVSNIWSTGFILGNVSDLHSGFDEASRNKACNFLQNNKQGLTWGYNKSWIDDTDSTNSVLLGLRLNGFDISSEHSIWTTYQKGNGGFSTYFNPDQLSKSLNHEFTDLNGWTNEHICVSALAYYYLCKTKQSTLIKNKIWDFIEKVRNENGMWESYWWTSPVYSTSFILQGMSLDSTHRSDHIFGKAIATLINLQQQDGSFADNFSAPSPFFTALAISALCASAQSSDKNRKEIENAVRWLISQQYTDGSFESSYSLQIPLPDILVPKDIKVWTKNENFTTNVLTNDFNRLFTTSSVLRALDTYNKIMAKNE